MVSSLVLMIVAVLSYSIINSIAGAWKSAKTRLSTFEGARAGFELLTNRLSQATLNTYWDYNDPENPTGYIRQSELHFIQGNAADLLPGLSGTGTQCVFFLAPLGFTETTDLQPLVKMLTACGFYIAFSGELDRPDFLSEKIPERHRYRLYQFMEPGEDLSIYQHKTDNGWFWNPQNLNNFTKNSYPMIENVIGLIIRAKYPTSAGDIQTYDYDSRPTPTAPPQTTNQLPPNLEVTLVVMDEDSARRLEDKYGQTPPPIIPSADSFDEKPYDKVIEDWETTLQNYNPPINYRIFTANIPIRGAKWSSN